MPLIEKAATYIPVTAILGGRVEGAFHFPVFPQFFPDVLPSGSGPSRFIFPPNSVNLQQTDIQHEYSH